MFASFTGNTVEEDSITKRDTIEDSVKHGLVNQYPESGMWFCVVKSKGVVIRHPIKPLHRISAVVLTVGNFNIFVNLLGYIFEFHFTISLKYSLSFITRILEIIIHICKISGLKAQQAHSLGHRPRWM
jgi:hypothetical protein